MADGHGFERGPCTLIVARVGDVDPARDVALLGAIEAEAGLPAGALPRTTAMDAPEFRLLEGVARPVADRVASVAAGAGFAPRVRDRLGIKWSSERGTEMGLWFAAAWVGFGLAWAIGFPLVDATLGAAARLPTMLLTVPLVVMAMGALYRWQLQKLYLPLVVSAFTLPEPVAQRAGALSGAAHEALDAIGRLGRALESGAMPAFAARDLDPVLRALRTQVQHRVREASALEARSQEVLSELQVRMVGLGEEPDEAAMDALQLEIEQAETAEAAREREREQLTEELLEVRQLAATALASLQADDPDLAPLERLRQLATREGPLRTTPAPPNQVNLARARQLER